MSTPQNPLAKFSSYSYHHVLAICDSSRTAEALETADSNAWRRNSTTDKYKPQSNSAGQYVILINGMTDAEFVINKATWQTSKGAHDSKDDMFTAYNLEGSIEIQEPRGIQFFNKLKDTYQKLHTDPYGTVWVLKTIFVGVNDTLSHGPTTEIITEVKPLLFLINDIQASFDVTGGIYNINFGGVNNGVTRLPQISRAAQGFVASSDEKNPTLGMLFASLQENIKNAYSKYWDCVTKTYSEAGQQPNFRPVEYELDAGVYADYTVDDIHVKNKNSTSKGATVGLPRFASIESALQTLLKLSKPVKEESLGKVKGETQGKGKVDEKYTPRIISTIDSTADRFVVKYKVVRHREVNNTLIGDVLNNKPDTDEFKIKIEQNLITFDYIYTGLNIDIINLDLKMAGGLAFFQTLVSTDNLETNQKDATDKHGQKIPVIVPGRTSTTEDKLYGKTPLFFSTNVKNPTNRNSGDPAHTISYNTLMGRFAGLEMSAATMKIVGNPFLLSTFNRLPSQAADATAANKNVPKEYLCYPNWDTFPALIKLNIKMPSTKADRKYYAETFWYDGYFNIIQITHNFDSGEFTQEITMNSLPNKTPFDDDVIINNGTICDGEEKKDDTAGTINATSSDAPTKIQGVQGGNS